MSEHTPGPWTFMEDEIFWGEIRGPNFELIAVMPELDERSEDFRLIAAAPELLEALEQFAHLAKVMEEGQFLHWKGVYVSYEQAQAAQQAIAKAKGEE